MCLAASECVNGSGGSVCTIDFDMRRLGLSHLCEICYKYQSNMNFPLIYIKQHRMSILDLTRELKKTLFVLGVCRDVCMYLPIKTHHIQHDGQY